MNRTRTWIQTSNYPHTTLAAAQTHRNVCRRSDEIAAFNSPVKPEPRAYRIRRIVATGKPFMWPDAHSGGWVEARTVWIVYRRNPNA